MTNKSNPNAGNVTLFPGAGLSDKDHENLAKEMRPADLSKNEIKVWNRIAPELSKLGRLKNYYLDVISEYCRMVVQLSEHRKFFDDNGFSYTTNGRHGMQEKAHPEVGQYNDDWRKFRSLVSELGLSPSAEKALSNAQGDLFPPGNPFDNV